MTSCEYLKRNAQICGARCANMKTLCNNHRKSAPYFMCVTGCGKVVHSKHGRTTCTTCDPTGARAQSRQNQRASRAGATPVVVSREPISPTVQAPAPSEAFIAAERAALIAALAAAERALAAAKDALSAACGAVKIGTLSFTDAEVDELLAEIST